MFCSIGCLFRDSFEGYITNSCVNPSKYVNPIVAPIAKEVNPLVPGFIPLVWLLELIASWDVDPLYKAKRSVGEVVGACVVVLKDPAPIL